MARKTKPFRQGHAGSKQRALDYRNALVRSSASAGERALAWEETKRELRKDVSTLSKQQRQKQPSGGSRYAKKHRGKGRR